MLEHPEWPADARFKTNPDRVKNQAVLYGWIEEIVLKKTSEEWQALLDEAEVPNAPMQSIDDVLAHPQTTALGMMQESPDRRITLLGLPLSFDGVRPAFRKEPPALGELTS